MQIPAERLGAFYLGAGYDPETNKIHLIGGKFFQRRLQPGICQIACSDQAQ